MNNLKKFATEADYNAATLNYPAVSWVVSGDTVHFDKSTPTPTFSGLTVYYYIADPSAEVTLFNVGSGSGSGSGSGGALPSAMIIDGTAVGVTNTYQFSTTGEHIVNYSFEDNAIPEHFLDGEGPTKFSTVAKVEIGDAITYIGNEAFVNCVGLTSCTIGSGVTYIGNSAFTYCSGLTSIDIPNGVTYIGESAFGQCSGLTSCTIGSGVTYIGSNAFVHCYTLTSISSNAITAPSLGSTVFNGISYNGVLTVPSGSQGYCGWIGGELPGYWTIEGVTCE